MAIVVSQDGKNARKIEQSHFALEDKLQEYVKNNPDIVPIYDIDEDARLLVLAREFKTNSGPIDALGVDQDGNVYVIETKLYKNPDKRTVLAQALDYGASLWKHSGDVSDVVAALDGSVRTQFGVGIEERLQEFFETDDTEAILGAVTKNISDGAIRFVILMDTVDDRLKDLVTYVNRNSKFDIYAVDLEYYKHDEFEIVIPKLYGAEVKKDVAVRDDSLRFDSGKIIEWLKEFNLPNLRIDAFCTKTYTRFTTEGLDALLPRLEHGKGGWGTGSVYYYEIRTDQSGSVKLFLTLSSVDVEGERLENMQNIIRMADRDPRKEDWHWFRAQRWPLAEGGGEEALKESLREALSVGVPNYEASIFSRTK